MESLSPYSAPMERRAAAHLLRRTTFGTTPQQVDDFAKNTPQQAVDRLMEKDAGFPLPIDLKTGSTWLPERKDNNSQNSTLKSYVITSWLHQMSRSDANLADRMVFFHHSHFATIQQRVFHGSALYYQTQLFRRYALGNFRQLATKICYDMAMLMHLDGQLNRSGSPNENFAREFLELYTIGKGRRGNDPQYTEQDVRAATRIFSGFSIDRTYQQRRDPDTRIPIGIMRTNQKGVPTRHDFEPKTFSSKLGGATITPREKTVAAVDQEITEFVNLVFAQPETARHICRKLYRFFVFREITDQAEREVIEPLADLLRKQDYELRPVLRTLLTSQHFFDAQLAEDNPRRVRGSMVKSPLELALGTLRYFNVKLPPRSQGEVHHELYRTLYYMMDNQGMKLYDPVEVAGYPAYHQSPNYDRGWISTITLAQRRRFLRALLNGIYTRDGQYALQLNVMPYVRQHLSDPMNPELVVQELLNDLFPHPVSEERFAYFLNEVLLDNLSVINWEMEWKAYRGGKSSSVERQFERLFSAVLQAPEYQLN